MTIENGTAIVLAYVLVSMGVIIAFLLAASDFHLGPLQDLGSSPAPGSQQAFCRFPDRSHLS
jgi:hypothetical protein